MDWSDYKTEWWKQKRELDRLVYKIVNKEENWISQIMKLAKTERRELDRSVYEIDENREDWIDQIVKLVKTEKKDWINLFI